MRRWTRWLSPLLLAASCFVGCRTPTPGTPPPCPKLQEQEILEIREQCGPELKGCPALEFWLKRYFGHCNSVDALR